MFEISGETQAFMTTRWADYCRADNDNDRRRHWDNNNRLSCGWTVNKCWRQNGLTTCILNGAVQTEAVVEWTDWAEIVLLTTWSLVHTN